MRLYAGIVFFVQPFSKKAKLWIQGRKFVWKGLKEAFSKNTTDTIWIHVSSLGEFEQGRPIIEKIREEKGNEYKILLTFFSPSGYELRKDYPLADYICYLPLDTSRNAKRLLDIVKPQLVYFVKYDFWYHYLHEVSRRNIPLYLVSSIFREKQVFFKPYGGFYRKILSFFTKIFVQEKASQDLLKSIGVESVVSGDTRVDRVANISQKVTEIEGIADFRNNKKMIIAGSSWGKDEDLLLDFLKKNPPLHYKLLLAPHDVGKGHIAQIVEKFKDFSPVLYSQSPSKAELREATVLVIDCIGLLSSLYQYGDVAYIGGAFGSGLHNTLEPATFSLPIVFGEKYQKFYEATILVARRGAFSIKNEMELCEVLSELLADESLRLEAGRIAREFIDENKGATDVVLSQTQC